jgi:hypothetical protein
LSLLMVSTVKYPRFPAIGFKTFKGLLGFIFHVVVLVMALWVPEYFLFPLALTYLTYGVARTAILGLLDKGDWQPPEIDTGEHGHIGPRLTRPGRAHDDRHSESME